MKTRVKVCVYEREKYCESDGEREGELVIESRRLRESDSERRRESL